MIIMAVFTLQLSSTDIVVNVVNDYINKAVGIKLGKCQVSPRYPLLSKTTLRNISGFLINKSGFKLYQYSKAS
ncbi:hypothetical protein [uncultured Gammaproteobacteria bacterium]|nr:hypothetical protein [uncultured Gammaproteobacteria bacterium]